MPDPMELACDYFNGCSIGADKTAFDEPLLRNMSLRYNIPVSELKDRIRAVMADLQTDRMDIAVKRIFDERK